MRRADFLLEKMNELGETKRGTEEVYTSLGVALELTLKPVTLMISGLQ